MTDPDLAETEEASADVGAVVSGVRGHVLLCPAGDRLAVWQVTADGVPTGAWVLDDPAVTGDPMAARRVMIAADRRALASVAPERARDALRQAAEVAGVELPEVYLTGVVDLRDRGEQINAVRASLLAAVDAYGATRGSRMTALEYLYEVPDTVPDDLQEALTRLGLGLVLGDSVEPAAACAVGQARLLAGWVGAWSDTESARLRRRYLRAPEHGGPRSRVLPERWLASLAGVYPVPLALAS